jgi:S-formylglutathione hydrolase FrmB
MMDLAAEAVSYPGARVRGERSLGLALLAIVVVLLSGASSARANQLVTITIPDRHGEIPSKWLPYSGPPRANVLLPDGYSSHTRYPLVLNLGGLGGDYAAATLGTSLHVHAIVVTPEPYNGWYTDWWNGGERGDPAWESYFLNEVIPAILARYPILPQRRYHAVVGISMGGLGATYLGGRLPGFFGSVASLSGFVDPQYFGAITGEAMGLVSSAPFDGDANLYPVYGPWDGFYATGHNPTRTVANLAQTRVFESTGTGVPTSAELADPSSGAEGAALESLIIYPMNQQFHQALTAAGIHATYQVHAGGHDASNFTSEIKAMFAWGLFKPVVAHPRSWTNSTVATSGQLWDIGYRFARPPTDVVSFRRTGSSLLIGSAGAAVTLTTSKGCVIHTATPATIHVPGHTCRRRALRRRARSR